MRKRLFWQIFGGFFLVTVISTGVITGLAWLNYNQLETDQAVRPVAEFAVEALDLGAGATAQRRQAGLDRARKLGLDMAVFNRDGTPISATRDGLPTPESKGFRPGFIRHDGQPGYLIDLPDGSWVSVVRLTPSFHPGKRFIVPLVIFLLVALAGCLLLARRITRRLESLEERVNAWGDGDLGARSPELGRDEIGRLALRFNAAADRVAELVAAHRNVVAHASHELRTPLARLRVALEMMAEAEAAEERERMLEGVERDIQELDALIEELLLRSKLEAKGYEGPTEPVALLELARAEIARLGLTEVAATGREVTVHGDQTLLRRALKNLLDNARKYGDGVIQVTVDTQGENATITVSDEGQGVPHEDRDRIFEPFYQRDPTTKGVGLGLALVRDIARHHGGDAVVEPNQPRGSRFVLTLPAHRRSESE